MMRGYTNVSEGVWHGVEYDEPVELREHGFNDYGPVYAVYVRGKCIAHHVQGGGWVWHIVYKHLDAITTDTAERVERRLPVAFRRDDTQPRYRTVLGELAVYRTACGAFFCYQDEQVDEECRENHHYDCGCERIFQDTVSVSRSMPGYYEALREIYHTSDAEPGVEHLQSVMSKVSIVE